MELFYIHQNHQISFSNLYFDKNQAVNCFACLVPFFILFPTLIFILQVYLQVQQFSFKMRFTKRLSFKAINLITRFCHSEL